MENHAAQNTWQCSISISPHWAINTLYYNPIAHLTQFISLEILECYHLFHFIDKRRDGRETLLDHPDTKDTKDLSSSKGVVSVWSVWYHNSFSLYFYYDDLVTKLLLPDLNLCTCLSSSLYKLLKLKLNVLYRLTVY